MNINYISILLICQFFVSELIAQDKCFEKGSKVIEAGIGIGLYKTYVEDNKYPGVIDKDTAGAGLYPISFEYGILDWLGCGGKFNYSNYIEDSTGKANGDSWRGIDFAATVRAHALRTRRIDLYAGIDFGFSNIAFNSTGNSGVIARGNGSYFSFNLNSRFYFGDHFGMRLFYNFDNYNYPSVIAEDPFGNTFDFSLHGKSFLSMGIGLMYKL